MFHPPCPPSARIRPARPDDINAITAIYRHHVRHGTASFETETPTMEEMAARQADLLERGYPYLVADQAGSVVGFAYASAYRPRAAYRDTVENSVYLCSESVGFGLGSRLLTALIAACEGCGFRQMIAVVGDSANLPSIRLHESHGFRLVGSLRSVGNKHGRWLDTVLLQRTLGVGDSAPPAT